MGKAKAKATRKRTACVYIVIDDISKAHVSTTRKDLGVVLNDIGIDNIVGVYRATRLQFRTETKVKLNLSAWSVDDK